MRFAVETSAIGTSASIGGGFGGGTRPAIGLKLILRRSVTPGDRARAGWRSIDSIDSTRFNDMIATESCTVSRSK